MSDAGGDYSVDGSRRLETRSEINFSRAPVASIISANSASDPIGVGGAPSSSSLALPRTNALAARPAEAERYALADLRPATVVKSENPARPANR